MLMSADEFAEWLRLRIIEGRPAAVVRFAGGEARLLFAERSDEEAMNAAIDKLERETGISFSPEEVLEIGTLIALAYDQADVLGVRVSERVLDSHKHWMRRLISHYRDRVEAGRPAVPMASCMLGHNTVDAMHELLKGRPVSVISCRNLKPVLESEWGLEDVAVYQMPSEYRVRDVDGAYEAAMHDTPIWPEAHTRVRAGLTVRERGEVFLVGAGVFGKDLCIRVRDLGGIAIDMGSALDRIARKPTRGLSRRVLDLHATGAPAAKIASYLLRLNGIKVDRETIAREIADQAYGEVTAWRARPLAEAYPLIHLEAMRIEIAEGDAVRGTACYLAFGVNQDGNRHPLGIWCNDAEDRAWRTVLGDLRNRGVRDLRLAQVDAPRSDSFSDALQAVFPGADVRANAESLDTCAAIRKAIDAHGPFPDGQAALTLVYLALTRAEAERRRPVGSDRPGAREME